MLITVEAAVKLAKTRPVPFMMVGKGTALPELLFSRSRVTNEELSEAKRQTGGRLINSGTCVWENDVVVFQCQKKPPWQLGPQLRRLIQDEARMLVAVEVRHGTRKAVKEESSEGEQEVRDADASEDDMEQ